MRFGLHWLADFLENLPDLAQLRDQLPLKGFEIAHFAEYGESLGIKHLHTTLVVAEITKTQSHPNADKLKVCQVTDGKHSYQIVCGAPNARTGIQVALALPGAVLPQDFSIRESSIRGVTSQGMLCSASELGLGSDHQGIIECTGISANGQSFYQAYGLDEHVLEIDITPNRGDCLSVLGMAREISAIFSLPLQPFLQDISAKIATLDTKLSPVHISVQAPKVCPAYHALRMEFSSPLGQSPLWMQNRLERCGNHAIHPFVDVTNFVMLELGQPLHAFDAKKIQGDIHVRFAQNGESIELLNGQSVQLQDHHLLIADTNGPLALGGVMGGKESAVCGETTEVILEAAHFIPDVVAGRSRELRLSSDACFRFERGVDPTLPISALHRAQQLLLAIAKAQNIEVRFSPIASQIAKQNFPVQPNIPVDFARLQRLAGINFPEHEARNTLVRLGMDVCIDAEKPQDSNTKETNNTWQVVPPPWRLDMTLMQDVLEELLRMHGMHALPDVMPTLEARNDFVAENKIDQALVEDYLVALGYQETLSYSFISEKENDFFAPSGSTVVSSLFTQSKACDEQKKAVVGQKLPSQVSSAIRLVNAISEDLAIMRPLVCISLLRVLEHNYRRQFRNLQVFETGLQFHWQAQQTGGIIVQVPVIAMAAVGHTMPLHWKDKPQSSDYFTLKGDIESLCARLGYADSIRFVPLIDHPGFHPGRSAKLYKDDQFLGIIGELHPNIVGKYTFGNERPVIAELKLDVLLYKEISHFVAPSTLPGVVRDLAFIVRCNLPYADIEALVKKNAGPYIRTVTLFDVFSDDTMPVDSHSLAIRLAWNNPKTTMNERQINYFCQRVIQAMEKKYGAQLRST